MFALDILLKCITAYNDDESGELVTDHWLIFKNYIFSKTFCIDFISTFPFWLIFSDDGELSKIVRLTRLPKAFKLFASQKFEAFVECIMKSKKNLQSKTWRRYEQPLPRADENQVHFKIHLQDHQAYPLCTPPDLLLCMCLVLLL